MPTFVIHAKKLFLTYSNVDPALSCEDLLHSLQKKPFLKQFYYFIAKETHQTGEAHFHALLTRQDNTKFHIKDQNVLDVEFSGHLFHGQYQPVKNLFNTVGYLSKGIRYITNMPNFKDGKLYSDKQMLFHAVKEKGLANALLEYTNQNLEKALSANSVSSLKKNFNDLKRLQDSLQQDSLQTPLDLHNFKIEGKLKEWVEKPSLQTSKTLILVGDSGVGKTLFAKAFLNDRKLKTLIVNHKEDFQKIDHMHDAILIDDANLIDFERSQLLAILDNTNNKTLRVLYKDVLKRKHLTQIVTMNYKPFFKLLNTLLEDAFARRVILFRPKEPFITNLTFNQVVNNYFYSAQSFQEHRDEDRGIIEYNRQFIKEIEKEKKGVA